MSNLLVEFLTIVILTVKFIARFVPLFGVFAIAGLIYLEITE